ncbi:Ig-like domain-containing protein [Acinetobacter sp. C32I]|nr:ABSDF2314 family large adhesin [Acinetobacter sp. C32I]USA55608.1 Ig-like domain-containing protein [Acinetobacter sp. C32I]
MVDVTATDAAGNESEPTQATADDTTAPNAPTADVVNDGTQVTGTAEPGSTVTVKDQNGNVLGTAVTDENGNYTVDLTSPLTNGEVVDVTATDAAGNESEPTQATADDTTAPNAPTADVVNDGTQVTGTAEPGSTVTVKDQNGNVLGTAVTDENGNYTVDLTTPLTNGEVVDVTATDAAGNESEPTQATADDTTAPNAPTAEFNDDGDAVTGTAEPGSTVTVKDQDGNVLGTAVTDENGNYTVPVNPADLANNEVVDVTATDAAGNESQPTEATAPLYLDAISDVATVLSEITPVVTNPDIPGGALVTFPSLSFIGPIIDLKGQTPMEVTVPEGGVMTFDVSFFGVLAGGGLGAYDLNVLRYNENTGGYEPYDKLDSVGLMIGFIGGIISGGATITDLPEGKYALVLTPGVGVNVTAIGIAGINVSNEVLSDYGDVVAKGNVITANNPENPTDVADVIHAGQTATVISVANESGAVIALPQDQNGATRIQGEYGELFIDKNGNYEYIRDFTIPNSLGKVDSFTYTLQDSDGHQDTATLNIRIDTNDLDITWPEDPTQDGVVELTATDNTAAAAITLVPSTNTTVDTGSMQASSTKPLFGAATSVAGSDTSDVINVAANTAASINFSVTTQGGIFDSSANGDTFSYQVQKLVNGVWTTQPGASASVVHSSPILGDAGGTVLISGSYQVSASDTTSQWRVVFGSTESNIPLIAGTNTTTVNTTVNATFTHYDQFVGNGATVTATGNLLTDDSGNGVDVTGGASTKVFVETSPGTYVQANGQTISVEDGTFVVSANGTYTFTANGSATSGDVATLNYKLVAATGDESTPATLSVNIGSEVISTASHDIITAGAGADTVVYNLLNAADATGGNGKDEWTDFNLAQGDKVDVSALLDGANADNIANYVSVTSDGAGNTLISIDRDGTGNAYNSTDLIVLKNTDTTLDELLNNNQLLF